MHIINCAGNGGMVCVNDDALADRIRLLRSWGRSSTLFAESEDIEKRFDVEIDGIPYDAKFVFETIGYNLEGAELGAAFGLVQHRKLPDALDKRKRVTGEQTSFFAKYQDWLELPVQNPDADTVWFAYPLIVKESAPFSRREVQIFLEKRNIQTRVIFTGNITRQPGFRDIDMRIHPNGLPNSDRIMERGFLIASHHGMTAEMLAHVHQTFEDFAGQF
jgi:CDP-6-deoxy-D-xylo-4-hexulose-3-dehydrase